MRRGEGDNNTIKGYSLLRIHSIINNNLADDTISPRTQYIRLLRFQLNIVANSRLKFSS